MAHCTNSHLLCKISGDEMIVNNRPLRLPNSYSYGYNSLAICQDDKAICREPKTCFTSHKPRRYTSCRQSPPARPSPCAPACLCS